MGVLWVAVGIACVRRLLLVVGFSVVSHASVVPWVIDGCCSLEDKRGMTHTDDDLAGESCMGGAGSGPTLSHVFYKMRVLHAENRSG